MFLRFVFPVILSPVLWINTFLFCNQEAVDSQTKVLKPKQTFTTTLQTVFYGATPVSCFFL